MQPPVSSIRSVLGGFAGLLILMGCLAVDSAKQTHDVSVTSAALRKESRDRDELLDQLRTDTYRSATLVRDYILERDDVLAASQKAELQSLRSRVEQSLIHYGKSAPRGERSSRSGSATARRGIEGTATLPFGLQRGRHPAPGCSRVPA